MFKQRSAFAHRRQYGCRLWQGGYFEHVVRADENCVVIAAYILANPIRAGLCTQIAEYLHSGSSRYTMDELGEAVQMRPEWK